MQAPADAGPDVQPLAWPEAGASLAMRVEGGAVHLKWKKLPGAVHYDVYRTDDGGEPHLVDGVKLPVFSDAEVLGGVHYRYFVRPCDESGNAGAASESVEFAPPAPAQPARAAATA
jgi:fibronectin type 3 domain-containing protein